MSLTGKAILSINPNAKINIVKEEGKPEVINWLDTTPISENEIEIARQKIIQNEQAIFNRTKEYGSLLNQIEFITENGLDAWQDKVAEIKAKYPKA
jgi:hypothetical protein